MNWLGRLLRRKRMEEDLDKELRFHLDEQAAELEARGHDSQEARRLARLAFGGEEQVKEICRDARGTRWLEDLVQDVRYALRTMRQNAGFSAVALATLGLGIGATTVMFTAFDGVLLKPLPYADPARLVSMQEKTDWKTQWGDLWAFAYPNFVDCRSRSRLLHPMAAVRYNGGTVSQPGQAEFVNGREVSADLFSMLGVPLFLGRGFLPEEDRPGGAPVAVIGYGLWHSHYGANPAVLGMPLVFEGKPYTVVGVTAPRFRLLDDEVAVFTPIGQNTGRFMQERGAHPGIQVLARLGPGGTLAGAQSELDVIGRDLAAQYPKSNKGRGFLAETLRPDVGDARSTLWLLGGAASLLLLIACVNIANLLLARAVSRERELAMRVALGAGRGRLARQCLTESAVLGIGGGALGVLLAANGLRQFLAFWPGGLPRAAEVELDWRVLTFAAAISILCGLLFGLAPALRAPVSRLDETLRAASRSVTGKSRRMHGAFVVSEVALAVVLLVAAGMLGRTLLRLYSLDPGVKTSHVVTARMGLSPAALASPAKIRAAWLDVLESGRRVPGVESIAMVDTVPMREGNNPIGYWTNADLPPEDKQPLVLANSVSPDYLKVMGIPLLKGRFFEDRDRQGSESVVVVDEVMAEQAFGGQDPLGKHLWIGIGPDPARVVGVVRHVRYWGPAADDRAQVRAQHYYPFAQVPDGLLRRWSELMSIAVRASVPPLQLVAPLRQALRGAANDQVLYQVRTMDQLAAEKVSRQRFLMLLFGFFAGLALLLACVGIYGVLAYLTSRRVAEIGVRMALGASARDVQWLVLRESLAMTLLGAGVGAVAALAAARVLEHNVEGMQPTGFSSLAVMLPALIAAALCASYLPARRASRTDPVAALRQE